MARGEMTKEAFITFLTDVFGCLANNTTAGSIHYTFMDWRHVDEMMATELKNLCVWTKTNAGMGTFYRSQHELVFWHYAGGLPTRSKTARGVAVLCSTHSAVAGPS